MFQRIKGVTVHYSTVDNDVTIASYAEEWEGIVLSSDSDFKTRFQNYSYQVYEDFEIVGERLELIKKP
jgi:predicted nuclease of predicted toxin-antitoxin system